MAFSIPPAARPAHVPPELVRDFDLYNMNTTDEDWQLNLKNALQAPGMPDVFCTPQNGRHWVAARGFATKEVFSNPENFSSRLIVPFKPMNPDPPFVPLQVDPPDHKTYRDLLGPALAPGGVQKLGEAARALAIELIEGFKEKGECEFIGDFATHLPIAIFMSMTDLPAKDRPALLKIADGLVRASSHEGHAEARAQLHDYAQDLINTRGANPGDDLISRLTQAEVNGARLGNDVLMGMVTLLLLAGLDTVASMMGFFARFLALNPDYRRRLIDDPQSIAPAIEELLRRHPIASPAREVRRDCTLGEAPLRAGDMIVAPTVAYGLDDRVFENPDVVDFERKIKIHETFGDGVHRCMGSMLARVELRVFIEEWLKRIPDFRIRPDTAIRMEATSVAAIRELPLVWQVG